MAVIAALEEMIITGKVKSDNTNPPTSGDDLGIPNQFIKTAKPNRPNTMDGTAARLFILTSIKSEILFFGANSSR